VDPLIEDIAAELRRPVRLDPRFDERVMAAIESPDVIPLRPALPRPWILRPWTISVSPLGGLAAAASIAGLLVLGVWQSRTGSREMATSDIPLVNVANTSEESDAPQMHQFQLVSSDARSVAVTGDFNDWDEQGTAMTLNNGIWTVIVPLRAGKQYSYQFIVDDTLRVPDPTVPRMSDGFGSLNSVITIAPRGVRR
jgi:hypothetical protein